MDEYILEKLFDFVNKKYSKKKDGDSLAHDITEIKTLFKIKKGDEKLKNIFI